MLRHIPTFEEVKHWATGGNIGLGDLAGVSASGEGSGNGFDADTVDGEDAAAFAQATHGHHYSDLSGVSGAGSGGGLNADLLDGKHASEIGGDGLTEEQVEDIVGAMAGYGLEYDDPDGSLRKTRQGPNPYDAAESWAESDLSLTLDHTEVVNGGVEIGSKAGSLGTTVTRTADNGWSTDNGTQGVIVNPNTALYGVKATMSANTSGATHAYLVRHSDGALLAEKTFSDLSGGDTVQLEAPLEAGTEYRFVFDADGSNWKEGYYNSPDFPYSSSDIDVTHTFNDGNTTISWFSSVNDVTAVLPTTAYSGSAAVEWPDDRAVAEWDVATFHRAADGGTVDVFVAYNDGSGWTRANGGNAISRAYSLADDAAISPGDNVRLEFELSRTDGAQSPRVDAAYLSWYV
jgi:hypothetical protein